MDIGVFFAGVASCLIRGWKFNVEMLEIWKWCLGMANNRVRIILLDGRIKGSFTHFSEGMKVTYLFR